MEFKNCINFIIMLVFFMYYIERSECWYVSTEDTDLEDGCVYLCNLSII